MSGRIYLLGEDEKLVPMDEALYDSERLLQELLANHPDLLSGEQINADEPRRWLLITREMSVQDEQDGPGRWSLDHLFLDQDAIPTLVEVKRSTDTRIRREVVGQMLDYAANAVAYWPVEQIRAKFESRCEKSGDDPAELLSELISDDQSPEDFWQRVKTNLQAGRIRMLFLADTIPSNLRRIVEFLNEQMDPAEVLAVEVKQYVGTGVKTLVPRVLGQTETARKKKQASAGMTWDEESFLKALRENRGEAEQRVAKEMLDWITPQVSELWWGSGATDGGVTPIIRTGSYKFHVCRISNRGFFVFRFDSFAKRDPFRSDSKRRELLNKINQIPDVHYEDDVIHRRARIPLERFVTAEGLQKLKEAVSWLIEQVNHECQTQGYE